MSREAEAIAAIAAIVNPVALPSQQRSAGWQPVELSTASARTAEEVTLPRCRVIEVVANDAGARFTFGTKLGQAVPLLPGSRVWASQFGVADFERAFITHPARAGGQIVLRCSEGVFVDQPDQAWPFTGVDDGVDHTLAYSAGDVTDVVTVLSARTVGTRLGVLLHADPDNANAIHFGFASVYASCIMELDPGEWLFVPMGDGLGFYAVDKTNAADLHLYAQEVGHGFFPTATDGE